MTAAPRRGDRYRPPPVILPSGPVLAAKAVALQFRQAVAASSPGEVARLTAGMTREQLIALAVVGFEAIPPGSMQLLQVVRARDEGDAA